MRHDFDIPDSVFNGGAVVLSTAPPVKVKVLGCNAAAEWLSNHLTSLEIADRKVELAQRALTHHAEFVNTVGKSELANALETERELRQAATDVSLERFALIQESLRAYDEKVFTTEVLQALNTTQLLYIQRALLLYSDPTRAGVCLEYQRALAINRKETT